MTKVPPITHPTNYPSKTHFISRVISGITDQCLTDHLSNKSSMQYGNILCSQWPCRRLRIALYIKAIKNQRSVSHPISCHHVYIPNRYNTTVTHKSITHTLKHGRTRQCCPCSCWPEKGKLNFPLCNITEIWKWSLRERPEHSGQQTTLKKKEKSWVGMKKLTMDFWGTPM